MRRVPPPEQGRKVTGEGPAAPVGDAIGIGAALILTLRGIGFRSVHLPAAFLFLLLWPAVVLQSAGAPLATFASWSLGLAIGAYAGVFLGLLPARLSREAAAGTGG